MTSLRFKPYKTLYNENEGGSHVSKNERNQEERKQFLLQLGLARHEAYDLAKETNFDINYCREKRREWLKNGMREKQVEERLLLEIKRGNFQKGGVNDRHEESYNRSRNERDHQQYKRRSRERDYGGDDRFQREQNSRQNYDRTERVNELSDRRINERGHQPYDRRSQERNYDRNMEISSYQRERDNRPNFDRARRDRNFENEMNMMRYDGRDQRRPSRSPEMYRRNDFYNNRRHSRSSSKDKPREERNFRSSRFSRSPPRGFDNMQLNRDEFRPRSRSLSPRKRGFTLDIDQHAGFQLPRLTPSPPRGLRHFDDYPSTTHSDRVEVSRGFSLNMMNFENPQSNIPSLMSVNTNNRNQNFESHSPIHMERNFPNTPSLLDTIIAPIRNPHSFSANNPIHSNIPSLMGVKTKNSDPKNRNRNFGNHTLHMERNSRNIPSLMDAFIAPIRSSQPFSTAFQKQPPPTKNPTPEPQTNLTIMEKRKLEIRLRRKEENKLKKLKKKENRHKRYLQRLRDPYKKPITNEPIYQCGFKKPPPELSKAKPQEYWSLWWPRYKYIEKSIPNISPEHKSIVSLVNPEESEIRKSLLLRIGVNKIIRNVDLTEKNYTLRDIFKLFKYKKQLENPKFHDMLASFEMSRVTSTLDRLENKYVMALLHQSLIARWHISLDIVKRVKAGEMIKSRMAYNLLKDPVFQYLVMESIQQLKEMCKNDWPEFENFYDSLDVTDQVVDLTTLGFFSNKKFNENKGDNGDAECKDEDGGESEDEDDEDDDENEEGGSGHDDEDSGSQALKPEQNLEERKQFLLQIGLSRHEAYDLANANNFNINHYQEKRYEWLQNGVRENQVNDRLLWEIKSGAYLLGDAGDGRNTVADQQLYNRRSYERNTKFPDSTIMYGFQRQEYNRQNYDCSQRDIDINQPPTIKIERDCGNDGNMIHYDGRDQRDYDGYKRNVETPAAQIMSSCQRKPENQQNYNRSQKDIERDYGNEMSMMHYDGRDQRRRSRSPELFTRRDFRNKRRRSRSPTNNKQRENSNLRSYQTSGGSSAPIGLNFMQQDMQNCNSLQSKSHSSPFGEIGFAQDFVNNATFQAPRSSNYPSKGLSSISQQQGMQAKYSASTSKSPSNSLQLKTLPDGGKVSGSLGNSILPSSNIKTYELPTSNTNSSSYDDSGNIFQQTQMISNVLPLNREITNNSESNKANQNPINAEKNSTNIPMARTLIPPIISRQPFSTAFWKKPPPPPSKKTTPIPPKNLTIEEQKKFENRLKWRNQQKLQKELKKQKKRERRLERLRDPYKKPVTDQPIIQGGFKKPPPGLSKANPKEYWSQWWPRYKYIENSIPHISPEHEAIIMLVNPKESSLRKNLLLRMGVNKISRNINLNEKNYAFRDTFKLFKYKKHLENPKFHDKLASFEMNRVRSALRYLEDQQVMALLHQSLIARWHISLDIVKRDKAGEMIRSRNAYNHLKDPEFQYLVKESIQQLKEICKSEWSEFEDFYNALDKSDEVIDLTTFGFNFSENSNESKEDNRDEESNDEEGGEDGDTDEDDDDDENEDEDKDVNGNQNPKQKEDNILYLPTILDDLLIPPTENRPAFTTAFDPKKLSPKTSTLEPPKQKEDNILYLPTILDDLLIPPTENRPAFTTAFDPKKLSPKTSTLEPPREQTFIEQERPLTKRQLRKEKKEKKKANRQKRLLERLNDPFDPNNSQLSSKTSASKPPREQTFIEQVRPLTNRQLRKEMKQKNRANRQKRLLERLNDPYKKPTIDHRIISCGLINPPPGFSKANPQEYWSQWWPRYKYIEKSLPQINPQLEPVRHVINFLLKPQDSQFRQRKAQLLQLGTKQISRELDLTEENYALRNNFKLFKYKKLLQDSNFHNTLRFSELNRLKITLKRLEDKPVMALLHQSLIARWHYSVDIVKRAKAGEMIKSNYAYNLLMDKVFQYLVKESIEELKKMCKQDWTEFEEFYNSLNVTDEVIDLETLGFYFYNNDTEDAIEYSETGMFYEDYDDEVNDDFEDINEDNDYEDCQE